MFIDDCLKGVGMIMPCDDLIATAINLGTSELVSINELVSKVEKIAGVKLDREYDLSARRGASLVVTATTVSSKEFSTGSRTRRSTRDSWPPASG